MRQELLKLIGELKTKTGWADTTIENKFGSPYLIRTIRIGKWGPSLKTAERFKAWLQTQLDSPS